jgi:hypothetical protein
MRYNPAAWYWIVADHPGTDVWSSAAAAYVPETDPDYESFLADGNQPTAIDSEESLRTVLAPVYPAGMPLTPRMQADREVAARIALGVVTTSTGTPAASATYPLDDAAVARCGATARDYSAGLGLPDPAIPPAGVSRETRSVLTVAYADLAGVVHDLTGEQLVGLYQGQRDLRATMTAQGDVLAGGGDPVWPDQSATIP